MRFSLRLREMMEVWVMAFPAIQEFALSSGVMVGKRDCDGSCSGLGLSGVSFWLFFSV